MRIIRSNHNWTLIGLLGLGTFVACSSDPTTPAPLPSSGASGGTGATGGSGASGGTSGGAGGTTASGATGGSGGTGGYVPMAGTGGTVSPAGGTGGTTGGTGGTAGGTGGAGGTAGTNAGKGGTGGTAVVVQPLDCETVAGKALPISLSSTWGFPDSGDDSFTEAPVAGNAECPDQSPGADPAGCWSVAWTPAVRTFIHWYWHNTMANWGGQGVCVADGAIAVQFYAKAATDGVAVTFRAGGVDAARTLTTEWELVTIDISGQDYNEINAMGGVNEGFRVVMDQVAAAGTVYFDDVTWVSELIVDGGEGGAGGGGPGAGGADPGTAGAGGAN